MAIIKPYEENTEQYEGWFVNNKFAYASELLANKKMLSKNSEDIGIGVGTGRFAVPSGIKYGIDPSEFYTPRMVIFFLKKNKFTSFVFKQILFRELNKITEIEPEKDGYGEGSFVVIKGYK